MVVRTVFENGLTVVGEILQTMKSRVAFITSRSSMAAQVAFGVGGTELLTCVTSNMRCGGGREYLEGAGFCIPIFFGVIFCRAGFMFCGAIINLHLVSGSTSMDCVVEHRLRDNRFRSRTCRGGPGVRQR